MENIEKIKNMENIELKKTTLSFGDYLLLFILAPVFMFFGIVIGIELKKNL